MASDSYGLPGCCGINELVNIYSDKSAEESLMEVDPSDQAIVVFSDVDENNARYEAGRRLAKLIAKEKLGVLVTLPPARNPNTGNMVKAWAWKIAPKKLASFQKKLWKADNEKWENTSAGRRFRYSAYDYEERRYW